VRTPPRLVTVWCPDWPMLAARVPPQRPAAIFHANRVVACTPAARAAGVRHGDRRRSAQSTCPEIEVLEPDPDRDGREFEAIVRLVAELAPKLEVVEPGWLSLAARGPARYFGGDQAVADRIVAAVGAWAAARGVPVGQALRGSADRYALGVGVADGRSGSAIAARLASSRDGGTLVVEPGGTPGLVAPLTIGWLRELGEADADLVDLLGRLGVRTLGTLAALDRGDVLARFGPVGAHAHRVASGLDDRPPSATDPPPEWWVEHPFDEPVESLDTVVFVAKRLADDLVSRLAADGRVCVRLVVIVETEHGERSERAWYRDHGLSAPAMVERARWQLEGWASQPGGLSGGVALVRFVPDEVRPDDGVQARLWGGRSQADHDAARAVVRLTGLAGEQAVRVPAWQGGRLPGERYRLVPAVLVDLERADERLERGDGPWPGAVPTPSPAVVPREPVVVEVVDADGAPVRVTGRGEISAAPAVLVTGSKRQRIVAWAGPWPVEQRWWSAEQSRRIARFQVVTERGVAHLVGVERQQWSILATYA
jgi:protein ImuB